MVYSHSIENGIFTIYRDGERLIGFAKPKAFAIASQYDALMAFATDGEPMNVLPSRNLNPPKPAARESHPSKNKGSETPDPSEPAPATPAYVVVRDAFGSTEAKAPEEVAPRTDYTPTVDGLAAVRRLAETVKGMSTKYIAIKLQSSDQPLYLPRVQARELFASVAKMKVLGPTVVEAGSETGGKPVLCIRRGSFSTRLTGVNVEVPHVDDRARDGTRLTPAQVKQRQADKRAMLLRGECDDVDASFVPTWAQRDAGKVAA